MRRAPCSIGDARMVPAHAIRSPAARATLERAPPSWAPRHAALRIRFRLLLPTRPHHIGGNRPALSRRRIRRPPLFHLRRGRRHRRGRRRRLQCRIRRRLCRRQICQKVRRSSPLILHHLQRRRRPYRRRHHRLTFQHARRRRRLGLLRRCRTAILRLRRRRRQHRLLRRPE